ncbi:MAG: aldo/keto reductase [Trueperaceae bacterium]|nr:aldo/keto reductase [Trueperaceae bacterium]
MQLRRFGDTELTLSELCFGTMRFAAKQPGQDAQSQRGMRALEMALEQGVNVVHSSEEYGTRWAVGEVLARHPQRHDVRHVIKVNEPDWGQRVFNKRAFRQKIEGALKELGAERIDVVQHLQRGEVDPALGYDARGEPPRLADLPLVLEPLQEVFDELRDEGLVSYLTTFPYTVGYAKAAIDSGAFEGVVAYFDLLETEMLDLFPDMRQRGMGFIGIRPLLAGLLTDPRIDREGLPQDDPKREPLWDRAYDHLSEVRGLLAEEQGLQIGSWTDFALRFSLCDPLIATTVVSINDPDRLAEAIRAVEGPKPDPALAHRVHEITTRYRREFGVKAGSGGVPSY